MKRILVAIDFSELSESLCRLGCRFAQADGAELHLLHVAAPDPEFVGFEAGPQEVRDTRAETLRDEHRKLEVLKHICEGTGIVAHMHLKEGATANTILASAEHLNAEMIVLGSHGHGALYNTLMGSVANEVLKRSATPVVFLPARSLE